MALQGVRVNFNGEVPILSAIIAEAERVGDLKIITVESHAQHVLVAFAEFPDGQVTLDATNSASISITDLSLVAPALYRLLWQVLVQLDGEPACTVPPLKLPLTVAQVIKFNRAYHRSGVMVMLTVLAVIVMTITAISAFIWMAWHWLSGAV